MNNNINTDESSEFYREMCNLDNIYDAFHKAMKGVSWKASVQYAYINIVDEVFKIYKKLLDGSYKQGKFKEFTINERGKIRDIKALAFKDRVVQKVLCEQILIPKLGNYIIDNSASCLKGKGPDFSRRHFKQDLHNIWLNNPGKEIYIVWIDYSKYFDSIVHDTLMDMLISLNIFDDRTLRFVNQLINTFDINGDHEKSLGIGSQISQILGVFYTSDIDNYSTKVIGNKYYGRYMDDSYFMTTDKNVAKKYLDDITEISKEYGLTVNTKKSNIFKASKKFTWLKINYTLDITTGVITEIPVTATFKREKKRIRKYRKLLDKGEITYEQIHNNFKSWYCNFSKYDRGYNDKLEDDLVEFETNFKNELIDYYKNRESSKLPDDFDMRLRYRFKQAYGIKLFPINIKKDNNEKVYDG